MSDNQQTEKMRKLKRDYEKSKGNFMNEPRQNKDSIIGIVKSNNKLINTAVVSHKSARAIRRR